jgi:hypothetical protein
VTRVFAAAAAVLVILGSANAAFAWQWDTPEAELAARFAPIVIIQEQEFPCDEDGEPFLPAPVEVVFNDPTVILREGPSQEPRRSPVESGDLYGLGDGFATDLPGKPREPGCDYETHFKQVMGDQTPVIYAHIATEDGRRGIALQYWFFYYFNNFNNLHEGDWEMIQLRFDASSVDEALTQEPVEVAFAQHDGGERAGWDAPKLEREGTRPVVYASRGSHASYFGPGLWLGWGQDNSGLGCDVTYGTPVRIDPEVRLIPNTIDSAGDPFAWVTYGGRWGERDSWVYDGPTGPAFKSHWTAPLSWMETLRADSVRVGAATLIGPAPSDVFCTAVAAGSQLFTLLKPYPWLVIGIVVAGAGLAVLALRLSWPVLGDTWRIYRKHFPAFAAIGAVTVPITVIFSLLQYLITHHAGFAAATGLSEDGPFQAWLSVASLVQRGLLMLLVTPVVILTVGELSSGRGPDLRRAFSDAIRRVLDLVRTLFRGFVIVLLLTVSVLGIPWAINRSVKWMFGTQATMLDDRAGRTALADSAAVVHGRWWRAAVMGGTLGFLGATPGILVGLALMIGLRVPVDLANSVSSLVYAIAQPFAIAGLTLLFLRWKAGSASGELVSR